MGKLTGAVLIAAGVAVGAYALYSYESYEHGVITVALAPSPAELATAQINTPDRARPDSQASATERLRAAWEGNVTFSPRAPGSHVSLSSSGVPRRVPVGRQAATAETPMDDMGLARELQRQLRRVGCYEGEINGVWTTSTRRAMRAFIDRVNATLPIEEPDSILLAIVQNHHGEACGTCPAGQGLTGEGRCLPNAMVARAPKKPLPVDDRGSFSAVSAARSDDVPTAGRMGLAGPRPESTPSTTDAAHSAATQDGRPVRSARPPSSSDFRARERRQERGWVHRAFPNSIF